MERPTIALKEWAIAVEALTSGKTILLLRKGGIREKSFQVEHNRVWLYPTYEHQKIHLLKPEYASAVTPVESGWHPETVVIKSYADITEILPVHREEQVKALLLYHVWNEQGVGDRFKWKPEQPLTALLLRVFRLIPPQTIPYHSSYGGCKSWLNLTEPVNCDEAVAVLDERDYQQQVQVIKELIN